jgi:hypothetical protein
MTYSESAKGKKITLERALTELLEHGVLNPPDTADFVMECWRHYRRRETNGAWRIDARRVMNWLGY